jgi:VanZ family protein
LPGPKPRRDPIPTHEAPEIRSRTPAPRILLDGLGAWWPALLWAAMMSYASTDTFSSQNTGQVLGPILRQLYPAFTQEQQDVFNFVLRKCAHLAEYFVLYLLVYRGVAGRRMSWRWSWGLGAWCIVAAYSILDEWHQSFVPSRSASPWDSLLDSTGALVAMCTAYLFLRFFRRDPERKPGSAMDK